MEVENIILYIDTNKYIRSFPLGRSIETLDLSEYLAKRNSLLNELKYWFRVLHQIEVVWVSENLMLSPMNFYLLCLA